MLRHSLVKTKSFLVSIELARLERFYVAGENSMSQQSCQKKNYIALKLILCRDREVQDMRSSMSPHSVI